MAVLTNLRQLGEKENGNIDESDCMVINCLHIISPQAVSRVTQTTPRHLPDTFQTPYKHRKYGTFLATLVALCSAKVAHLALFSPPPSAWSRVEDPAGPRWRLGRAMRPPCPLQMVQLRILSGRTSNLTFPAGQSWTKGLLQIMAQKLAIKDVITWLDHTKRKYHKLNSTYHRIAPLQSQGSTLRYQAPWRSI